MNEIKMVHVHKSDELGVKALFKSIKDDSDIIVYLPDLTETSKPIERSYFFKVLNTLQPDYINHIIKQSQERRNNPKSEEQKHNYILISDDWLTQLTSHPFVSKKNGRTLQLLKSSAKIFKPRKPKQPPQSVTSLKRFKGHKNLGSAIKSTNNNSIFDNPFSETQQIINEQNISKMRFNI